MTRIPALDHISAAECRRKVGIVFELPWPPRELHPNARVHWARKAKATKASRTLGSGIALAAGIRRGDPDIPQNLKVTAVFFPPDNRRRDVDGMLSSIKAYLDGIADVLGVDDSRWEIAIRREGSRKGGAVHVELEDAA